MEAEQQGDVSPRLTQSLAVLTKVLNKTVDISSLKGVVKAQLRRF
jgi:hypothetical protein